MSDHALEPLGLEQIEAALHQTTPADDHAVRWIGASWAEDPRWDDGCRSHIEALADALPRVNERVRRISRRDVFDRRDADPVEFFIAAMAWGFGDVPKGSYRAQQIFEAGGRVGVTFLVRRLRELRVSDDMSLFYEAWTRRPTAIKYIKTSFASKLAYFAAFDRVSNTGPLIADKHTAAAASRLAGIEGSLTTAGGYAAYVSWARRVAVALGCRSDQVELALFSLGRSGARPAIFLTLDSLLAVLCKGVVET